MSRSFALPVAPSPEEDRMLARFLSQLSYANVVSTICLFVVLGGTAYAATTLPNNSVGSAQLKANAVTSER